MRSLLGGALTATVLAASFAAGGLGQPAALAASTGTQLEAGAGPALALAAAQPEPAALRASCSPGAHTLSSFGERVYPETGNGGYTSVHTDVDLRYSAATNTFLPGNHVVLTELASQCLTSFTLDFEPTGAGGSSAPALSVSSVTVDGQPADFSFVQPTYPGDPNGQEDPDPRAHEAGQGVPVGGPTQNPLPPACSPELPFEGAPLDSQDGTQCAADKLLITPRKRLRAGASFAVDVSYTGRPGVHKDANGEEEGWFRAPDGSLVATEPIGARTWMPLNDYPSAKPTYSFHETVEAGKVAVANGVLSGATNNPPDAGFPAGSVTWNWDSDAPVASYLVQSSVGNYALHEHVGADGVRYYEAQDEEVPRSQQKRNAAILAKQEEVTDFESRFNGPFPFVSDGAVVGTPVVSFAEEMQSMISFNEGVVEVPLLWHENNHQWWGDNVSEASYEMTFFKEGLAEWMESYVYPARSKTGTAFERSLMKRFNKQYASGGHYWTIAPSHPFAYSLFDNAATYERPATAYEALRRILGAEVFYATLQGIQRSYGGAAITEDELEAAFQQALPNQAAGCHARLAQFFSEWFDTAYAPGGGAQRPSITGPGLAGGEFYDAAAGCPQT